MSVSTTAVSGTVESGAGPIEDYSHTTPTTKDMGVVTTTPHTFVGGEYTNTGNVDQTVSVVATNLSANINSVTVDFDGSNSAVVTPGTYQQPQVTIDANIPEDPIALNAAPVSEAVSFDLVATWN